MNLFSKKKKKRKKEKEKERKDSMNQLVFSLDF